MTTPIALADVLRRVRTLLLLVLTLGLFGIGAELVAFEHFEDAWQAAPIASPPIAGLQGMCATESRLIVTSATSIPMRAAMHAASQPA